jgi:hypothetical protein
MGRHATSLEDQAIKASDQTAELLMKNIGPVVAYQEQFQKVFGTGVTPEGVAKAIAAYERMILAGNATALSPAGEARARALRGQGAVREVPGRVQLHRREL